MASVQMPPAQHGGQAIPAGLSQQQAHEAFNRYQQLKKQGVPASDPEFKRLSSLMQHLSRQQEMRKQQMQQHQQQMQKGVMNGTPQPPSPSPAAALGASAMPATSTAPASSTGASPAPSQGQQTSSPQLAQLKAQIQAFKLLSRNVPVPVPIQRQLFEHRARRLSAQAQALAPVAARSTPTPDAPVSAQHDQGAFVLNTGELKKKPLSFKTFKDPYTEPSAPDGPLVPSLLSYKTHSDRRSRWNIPGILPHGIDFDQLRIDREKIIFNRMSARYWELKNLPGNLAHWDTAKDGFEIDETAKRKAIIEMKCIALYSKQRALRDRIGKQMMTYDNLAMTTNRSNYRRMKKQSVREARITEKLEKQQRDARENRERKKHTDFLAAVYHHRNEVIGNGETRRLKMQRIGRVMNAQHFNIEKEEQKRIERTAKQRLQALKANDEEAYLKLLDQAKDTRITHLLRQTDGFLHQLASSVRAQQRDAAERYGDETVASPDEDDDGSDDEEEGRNKIDYYAVAHRIKEKVTRQADMMVGGTLKEYQVKGLQWMLSLYNNNLNGILADEMGLGKTIQTISLITYLIERKQQPGPYLVIVPLSTLSNWNNEFEKWAPSVAKVVYKGPPQTRRIQQEKIRHQQFQVLLTTFEYIIKDRPILSKIKWFHMIIDEGHRMKNSNSKLSATISQYYHTRFRLILTGTPLQNNLTELWAMLNFVLPNIFKSATTFDEWFNTPFANTGGQDKMELTEEEQILVIRRLHKVLRPFLLRRLKKDVEKDLPDKTEKVIKCKFSALQSRLYKQMVTHNRIAVGGRDGGKTGARGLSNMIMQLRKLCNHPFAFDEVEDQMNPNNISNDILWRTAGKFELLDRILPKYKATGHRVLMFFQMTSIMDIMEDFLRMRGILYLRLDGMTKSDDRSSLLKEYNRPDSPYFMFLLSTRAGGLGLNLQTADTVIIYDSDWNPHQDLQAQDRAHRIGQKNEVRILRLISANSVEEKILERARFKLDMDGKVIQAGRFDQKTSETERDAMLRTLLETADMAENGEQEDIGDEELNMILARSEEEIGIFQKMDDERARDPTYGTAPGCRGVPRLMTEAELPDLYLNEGNPVDTEEEVVLGRGARERTKVRYDDGLTEEQWLNAVDDEEDSPEAAAARKQAKKDRRETNRLRKLAASNNAAVPPSPSLSHASTDEIETPVKKRGRRPGAKNAEKRKAVADEDDVEPPTKKRRGPIGRPSKSAIAAALKGTGLTPETRDVLNGSLRRIYTGLMTLEVDIDDPPEPQGNDEDVPTKQLIIGPFVKLPNKREWQDYYLVITSPICMKDIEKKLKKGEYLSLGAMRRDLDQMVANCRTFNEPTSKICEDVNIIEAFYQGEFEKEVADHSELAGLEDRDKDKDSISSNSVKDTSVPPSTGTVTPAPSSAAAAVAFAPAMTSNPQPTRIRLVSSNSQTNGNGLAAAPPHINGNGKRSSTGASSDE